VKGYYKICSITKMEVEQRNLIEAIEEERISRRMDQGEFSEFLGISESYYSMIKSGTRRFNLNILILLMQKLPAITPGITIFITRQGNDGGKGKSHSKTGV